MQHVRIQSVHRTLELTAIQFSLAELAEKKQDGKFGIGIRTNGDATLLSEKLSYSKP